MATKLSIVWVNSHDRRSSKDQLRLPCQEHELHHHSPPCCYLIRTCLYQLNQSNKQIPNKQLKKEKEKKGL